MQAIRFDKQVLSNQLRALLVCTVELKRESDNVTLSIIGSRTKMDAVVPFATIADFLADKSGEAEHAAET